MSKVHELVKTLNTLYDYGEWGQDANPKYLLDLHFLVAQTERFVISKKWVKFSGQLNREDFIASLLAYYPPLLENLLIKVYQEAVAIGKSGDGQALFEFVDCLPKFAAAILQLKVQLPVETEEVKGFYQEVFGGYPHYQAILSRLQSMQLAEDYLEEDCPIMGTTPNENWVKGRRISAQVDLAKLANKPKYALTPYSYQDFPVQAAVATVLSEPWQTFVAILLMLISEYRIEGLVGLAVRPTDAANPYTGQPLKLFIYNTKGCEVRLGSFNDFGYEFAVQQGFLLFPDQAPKLDKVIFRLLDREQVCYQDGEYLLNPAFLELIYSRDIILKNRSRKLKSLLKEHLESLRSTL